MLELVLQDCEALAKQTDLPKKVDRKFWDDWLYKRTLAYVSSK